MWQECFRSIKIYIQILNQTLFFHYKTNSIQSIASQIFSLSVSLIIWLISVSVRSRLPSVLILLISIIRLVPILLWMRISWLWMVVWIVTTAVIASIVTIPSSLILIGIIVSSGVVTWKQIWVVIYHFEDSQLITLNNICSNGNSIIEEINIY